jgi:DNA replication protein DnaC
MIHALNDQNSMPGCEELTFMERLGLLVDREMSEKQNVKLARRLKSARLRQDACVEDIDFRYPRGLDRKLVLSMASCQWIKNRDNCAITGKTGVGKSFLACAFAQKACREGYSVYYARTARLLQELASARADGTYTKRLAALARTDLLVLDDWAMAPLNDAQRRDLFEVLDDRYDRHSTLVAAQVPIEQWYESIGDPTLADAILDRLVHNAHKICLKGPSIRKIRGKTGDVEVAQTDAAEE